jgi:sec-independent protein translocase protein TatB
MFDIGFWEMLVIGVMALVVLGPERLPGAIRSTISTIRNIKELANGFKQEVATQLDVHELHANLKKAESLGMENLGKDLQDSVNELKAAAASVQQPYKTDKTDTSHNATKQLKQAENQEVSSGNAAVGISSENTNNENHPTLESTSTMTAFTPTNTSKNANNE